MKNKFLIKLYIPININMKNQTQKYKSRNKIKKPKYSKKQNYTNHQIGGEKIGQGGFGCVLKPYVKCLNTKNIPANAVSKITYVMPGYETDYQDELQILKYIRNIDPTQIYFISLVDECELDISKVLKRQPKDTISVEYKDDDLNEYYINSSEPKYIQLASHKAIYKKFCLIDSNLEPRNQIQLFGGYSLNEITPTSHADIFRQIIKNYRRLIIHILKGLQILHKNRIAHRDIKEFNFLGAIQDNKPIIRYIDFGLSQIINPNENEGGIRNFHYAGSPGYIPFEFVLLHYMSDFIANYGYSALNNSFYKSEILKKTKKNYDDKYSKFFGEIHLEQSIIGSTPTKGIRNKSFFDMKYLAQLYDQLLNSLREQNLHKLLKADTNGLLYKGDIFGLGITLGFIRIHFGLTHDDKLTNLISHMVKLEPNKRYNINECLSHPFCKI